jgi:hypothetical protein
MVSIFVEECRAKGQRIKEFNRGNLSQVLRPFPKGRHLLEFGHHHRARTNVIKPDFARGFRNVALYLRRR